VRTEKVIALTPNPLSHAVGEGEAKRKSPSPAVWEKGEAKLK
jgi:hypothetical protein